MNDRVEVISVPVVTPKVDFPDVIDIAPREALAPLEDPQVKIRAYDMFLNTMKSFEEIAVELAVPLKDLKTWVRQGNWVARKQDIMDTAMRASDQRLQEFIIRNRQPTAERHLKVATKIEDAVDKTLEDRTKGDKVADPKVLKTLAEALSSSAGVSGKAVGITDAGIQGDRDSQGKKTPVVIVNLAPTLSRG